MENKESIRSTYLVLFVVGIVETVLSFFGGGFIGIAVFIIALILNFVFGKTGSGIQGIILTIINALMVTFAAMGGYEVFSDPMAQKQRVKNKY